ncbi:PREDICTED: uncharacterized protein LOC108567882 isoform X2 [Nicrophorus vespilloides]|uniref:Uncharacterized protein LOC108567882 isoform X2 n=1 Tax=Nicrophorus vespilloides TaxID=110193 RepID=A0ABM1NB87_NICVS|nr:PREDICTED: uncharacterized protein LOC108567882 isoform X2 [Nicrophorus vespilloides]
MNKYLSSSWNSVVSIDLQNSWAAKSLEDALRQSRLDARFQQKQMQEKEEKLLKLYENQQQRAFERVGRGSAGNNGTTTLAAGKVRQMFDERRQKAGIDKSYPLEPLKTNRTNTVKKSSTITTSTAVQRNVTKKAAVTAMKENNNVILLDEAETYLEEHKDIVDMMNNHNLEDKLDDEELPQIGFDEFEEPTIVTGKLANVGGKLPSQVAAPKKKPPQPTAKTTVKPKTIMKKPLVKSTPAPLKTPSRTGSLPNSPSKPKMSAKKPQPGGDRAPAAVRPSSTRQTTKASAVQRDDLTGCRYCQRRFASDRIQTHEDICARTGKKKRKAYDATKHRLTGTELEPYARRAPKTSSRVKPSSSKSNWRQKHEEFISAIRAAKQAQAHIAKGGNIRDLPPPPPSSNPDYVQCPHCGRRFNQTAADRHIPKCANYSFNKPKPGAPKPVGRR